MAQNYVPDTMVRTEFTAWSTTARERSSELLEDLSEKMELAENLPRLTVGDRLADDAE